MILEQVWDDQDNALTSTESKEENTESWILIHIDEHEQSCADDLTSEKIWDC